MTIEERRSKVAEGENIDPHTVEGFGAEWTLFDYSNGSTQEVEAAFNAYFRIFPWEALPSDAVGADVGCGTGRWARFVAPRVGLLHCIDASADALDVARRNLEECDNCRFHLASVDAIPIPDSSIDFAYSLGVLHHLPDTRAGLSAVAQKLKPGGLLLVYLYYALDDRPGWYRGLWKLSDLVRRKVARMSFDWRRRFAFWVALLVYWPLARMARLLEIIGFDVEKIPLSAYRSRSFYMMKTDSLDRFGTRLEQRFTREQIREMMTAAGLTDIVFSQGRPFWTALGRKPVA